MRSPSRLILAVPGATGVASDGRNSTFGLPNLVVVAAPSHHLAERRRLAAIDLTGETLFVYVPREESSVVQQFIAPSGATPNIEQVQLTEAMIELVKAGLGVTILARWAVQPHLDAGTLTVLPIKSKALARRWSAVTLKQSADLPHVRDFIELLSEAAPRSFGRLPAVGNISANGRPRAR